MTRQDMRVLLLCCVVVMSAATGLRAQPADTLVTVGLVGGGTMLLHQGSFTQLGSYTSCCPEFTTGTGVGGYIGGFATLPLSRRWGLHLRLIYTSEPGTLVSVENVAVADLRDSARVVQAEMTHELKASLSSLGVEPLMALRVGNGVDVLAGARLAAVLGHSFQQTETLTKPEDYGSYLGAGRTWVNHQADIPDASSVRATAVLGARMMVPLRRDGSFFMAPEAFVHIPLTDVAAVRWKITELRLGVSLGWALQRSSVQTLPESSLPVPAPPVPAPPVRAAEPPPTLAGLTVVANNQPIEAITVERTEVTELVPVLGHIYFDEGTSELPDRYRYRGPRTTPSDVVYSVLPIVAKRMQQSSGILTITGTTSATPADQGLSLARQRAERIRQELINLGIPPHRLRIEARRLPRQPTAAAEADEVVLAEQENRRAEITCTDPDVLASYAIRTVEQRIVPEVIRLRPSVVSYAGVVSTTITVGEGSSARAYQPETDLGTEAFSSSGVTATIVVVDSAGRTVRETVHLPVSTVPMQNRPAQSRPMERYRLMLFPFNSAELTADHLRTISSLKQRLSPNDTVRVIGLTDTMGSTEHNMRLSEQRARAVAKALDRTLGMGAQQVVGRGAQRPLLSNGLPEGRAYNRTVIIEVQASGR